MFLIKIRANAEQVGLVMPWSITRATRRIANSGIILVKVSPKIAEDIVMPFWSLELNPPTAISRM